MAGGDGSQALVATVAAEHDIPHVCIPAGMLNPFARDWASTETTLSAAWTPSSTGVERRVDLATVNGRVFVNNASMPLRQDRPIRGLPRRQAQNRLDMRPELLGPDAEPFDLRFGGAAPCTL